jgi:hypothetical protein
LEIDLFAYFGLTMPVVFGPLDTLEKYPEIKVKFLGNQKKLHVKLASI